MSVTNHALGIWTCTQVTWQFRVISPRRCICKIPWPNGISKLDLEFPSWGLRKSEESRARIAVDREIEATSSLKDLINPKSITRKDFSDFEELDFDDGSRIENGATILFIWSTKLPSVEPWQAKGRTILTRSGRLKNVFSGRQLGLVQEETLVVFYTRMPRETVRTTWNEVEIRKKSSPGASILFSTESEETDWRKSLNSLKASPATKAKKSLSMVGKTKNIAMRLSTSSRVSWLQVWKQMRSWLTLPYFDKLMVRTTSRRRYSRSSCRSREKKRPRLCISKIKRQWLLFYGKLKN